MRPNDLAATKQRALARKRADRLMAILAQKLKPATSRELLDEKLWLDEEWRDAGHDTRGEACRAAWRAGKGL